MQTPHLSHTTTYLLRVACFTGTLLLLAGCSTGKMVVRGSQSIMDSGIEAMNSETDLQLARAAMPANLKLMEGMLLEDPDNIDLLLYAAQGFYGYSYGFIETEDTARASALYRRCYDHARRAFSLRGFNIDPETASADDLRNAVAGAGEDDVPAIFWTGTCLGKWADMNRDNVASIAGLGNVAILMQRVIELDENYYYGAAHLFFGVYYGGLSPMFGGDFALSEQHFQRAAEINDNKLLLVDLLHAEYLDRQQLNQAGFHQRLTGVLAAPDDLYPQMALVNAISKHKAALLLEYEDDWF
ncbi:MAG: TRAP transporter TatT component family protein [Gammaproteobacteria bacterium]